MLHDPNYDGQGKSAQQEAADSVRMLGWALIAGLITLVLLGGLLARPLMAEIAEPIAPLEVAAVGE